MSDNTSLFIGEDEHVPSRRRAVFEEDSGSESDLDLVKANTAGKINAADRDFSLEDSEASEEESEDESVDGTIYCICRKASSGFMVGCDGGCEDWFHGKCVGIDAKQKDTLKTFVCATCTSSGGGVTVWEDEEEDIIENVEDEIPFCPLDPQLPPLPVVVAQPPAPVATVPRPPTARKRLHAKRAAKQKPSLPVTPGTSLGHASRQRAIRQKLKYSHPGFETCPPGSRGPYESEDEDVDGGGAGHGNNGDDDGVDGARRKRRAISGLSLLVASMHQANTQAKILRRTYVDVDDHPTSVDALVKKSLEEALFGSQTD